MMHRPDPPPDHIDDAAWEEDEAPPDALPANPVLRKITIAIYILIVLCVIIGLLLSMVLSGLFVDDWSIPLPESWSI